MPKFARLGGPSDCIESDFVKREATPEPLDNILEQRGFEHETANPEPDVRHVEISRA